MGILGDYTIDQLRSATANQITQAKTAVKNKIDNMTKKQFFIFLLRVADVDIENMEIQDREEGEDSLNGQIYRIRTFRDVLGNFVKRERLDWTYHPGSEGKRPVNLITRTLLDLAGNPIDEPEVVAEHSPNGGIISK